MRLIEHTRDAERIPLDLVDQHVDAVRAMLREAGDPAAIATAIALGAELRRVTDAFLAHENRDRPDHLDDLRILPPSPRKEA